MKTPLRHLGRIWTLGVAACLVAGTAGAEALDLRDARPRWVAVAFEISPAEHPARLRGRFSTRLPARLVPSAHADRVEVRVDGALVERYLLTEHDPKPGSFGDFVWTFDTRTGHVEAASLSGDVRKELGWGFARLRRDTHIEVEMSTHAAVAFETVEILGERLHGLCDDARDRSCTRVEPHRLDPRTGYVNAVGALHVAAGALSVRSFSPLGEAIFSEIDESEATLWSEARGLHRHADVAAPAPAP